MMPIFMAVGCTLMGESANFGRGGPPGPDLGAHPPPGPLLLRGDTRGAGHGLAGEDAVVTSLEPAQLG